MNWGDIQRVVEEHGNVATITMEQLRDAHGSAKLGVHVRAEISSTLAGMGLGHVPQELPSYQHEQVRIYKRGTPIGELIETVLTPGQQNDRKLTGQAVASGHAVCGRESPRPSACMMGYIPGAGTSGAVVPAGAGAAV